MSPFFNGLKTYKKKTQFKNKKTYLFFNQYYRTESDSKNKTIYGTRKMETLEWRSHRITH